MTQKEKGDMTHTYAILDVPPEAYVAVRTLLTQAGYQHTFHTDGGAEAIDMHGIALRSDPALQPAPSSAEGRVASLLGTAFADAHHPAMLDWVSVMFELKRLRRAEADAAALRSEIDRLRALCVAFDIDPNPLID